MRRRRGFLLTDVSCAGIALEMRHNPSTKINMCNRGYSIKYMKGRVFVAFSKIMGGNIGELEIGGWRKSSSSSSGGGLAGIICVCVCVCVCGSIVV